MAARLRTSDRDELTAKRDELSRRVESLDLEFTRSRDRIVEVREQKQQAQRDHDAAQEVFEQAKSALSRAELNMQVLVDQQEKNGERLEETRRELSEVEALIGQRRTDAGLAARETASVDEALKVVGKFGTIGDKDLAAVLQVPLPKARQLIGKLVAAGNLTDTGAKVLGQSMYEYVPTDEQKSVAETEAIRLGRDWICDQKKAFTRVQLQQAAELNDDEAEAVIDWARQRGALREIGVPGAEIFEYDPPKNAGKGAVIDMRRRPAESVGGGGGGGPVAGTGRGLKITDPDVRALVSACERLGATVKVAGDGHLRVEYNGKSVNIAATPSSRRTVLNDRARVRRQLGLQLAG